MFRHGRIVDRAIALEKKFAHTPRLPLLIDMDDTLFRTTEHMMGYVKRHHPAIVGNTELTPREYWWDDIGRQYGLSREYFKDIFQLPGFFENIPADADGIKVLTVLHEAGVEIKFLTAPQHNQLCFIEKIHSLERYFPWFNPHRHFLTAWDKSIVNGILVDDNPTHDPDILFMNTINATPENIADSFYVAGFINLLQYILLQPSYLTKDEEEYILHHKSFYRPVW